MSPKKLNGLNLINFAVIGLICWALFSFIQFNNFPEISPITLQQRINAQDSDFVLIDVRTPAEYQFSHINGAHPIPLAELSQQIDRIKKLAENKQLITYCAIGPRSYQALGLLKQHQINAFNLTGGFEAWYALNNPN